MYSKSRKKIDWKKRELYSRLLSPEAFILRIDGRNFSNILKEFEKPYDLRFTKAMVETCKEVMREFNPLFAYIFSDEVNFLFKEIFGCRVEKIDSIIASEFSSRLSLKLGFPVSFDSRIIYINIEIDEILDYLKFRQDECWRNHLNSYAFYTLLKEIRNRRKTQEFLKGKKSREIHEMLFGRGINISKTPTWGSADVVFMSALGHIAKRLVLIRGNPEAPHPNVQASDNVSILNKSTFTFHQPVPIGR